MPASPSRAMLSLLAAMVLTGANVTVAKALVAEIPIYLLLLYRFVVACAALALLVRGEEGPRLEAMTWVERRDLVAMAFFGMVGYATLIFEGVRRTSAADAGIIAATLPAVVALTGILFMRERPGGRQAATIALAVAGLVLLQWEAGRAAASASSLLGNILVFGAVLCEAAFVIIGKRLAPPYRPLRLSLGANLAGLVMALPLAAFDLPGFDISVVRAEQWLLATWYALTSSVVCLWLWYRGLPNVPTWLAGLATAALPVAAMVTAVVWLGESLSALKLAGAGLVMAGIVAGAISARGKGER